MTFVFRTHRGLTCLFATVICGVGAGFYGQKLISIPFLGSLTMPTQMPAPVIPALLLCVILGACVTGAERPWMHSSVRNIWAHSAIFVLVLALLSTLLCAGVGALTHQGMVMPGALYGRDLAGLLAIWVLGRFFGLFAAATVLPVGYVVFASAFARNKEASFYPWAWIMESHPQSWTGLSLIATGVVATLILAVRRRPLYIG